MAGKKIGKLSKSMIIRRKPREAAGPAGERKRESRSADAGLAELRGTLEASLDSASTLVIPRHGKEPGGSSWDSAKVVPLHPRAIREAAQDDDGADDDSYDDGDFDDGEAVDRGVEARADRPAVRRPVSAAMPKSGTEQAAFEQAEATNDLLVKALRSADLGTAETLFGRLAGLSPVATLAVLYDPKGEDLALTCRALGMDQLQFVSVYILSRKLGLGEEALAPQDLARLVALFEASDLDEARARLKGLQEGKAGSAARPFRRD
ncbi:MAG TPA: hypothetical protein VKN76_04385 [Kiloniellaceae bacterium]|nr:hypothetical protein [Kiloniellaceae bacterium]